MLLVPGTQSARTLKVAEAIVNDDPFLLGSNDQVHRLGLRSTNFA